MLNSQGLALAKVTVGGMGRAGPPTLSQPYPGHLTPPLPSCRGATSVVYSCEEKGTGTPYAAKILKKTVSGGGVGVWGCFCSTTKAPWHKDRRRAVSRASLPQVWGSWMHKSTGVWAGGSAGWGGVLGAFCCC